MGYQEVIFGTAAVPWVLSAMAMIIDGYNLLHEAGIFGRNLGPRGLERSRRGLLNFLVSSLGPRRLRQTVVVFDAHDPPVGLPRTVDYQGLTVKYAQDYENADALIEELIFQHSAPRTLTVVSSDHRVQRAARRRKAKPIDSRQWYVHCLRERREKGVTEQAPAKPQGDLSEAEVQFWLNEFGQ